MFGSGRSIGIVLMATGVIVACGGSAVSVAAMGASYHKTTGGMMLWIVLPWFAAGPLFGFGAIQFFRGRKALRELATIQKQKKILTMIRPQGRVRISEIVQELQTSPDEVKHLIYDLVGQDLLHGYVDWNDDMLCSKHILVLQGATHCPRCGGEQTFVGKGVVKCRHCDVQVLL